MVLCCKMENPFSAMWGEVDPETCDQLLKYMTLNICWPESILNHGLQNICWLNKFFAGGLTGCFGAGQLLAYFKFLKIIFNKKRGKSARERALLLFLTGAALGMSTAQSGQAGRVGSAGRAGGSPAVGSAHGGELLSISPRCAWPARGGGGPKDAKPLRRCLPPAWFGQEGGSRQLAPCPGIVLGLNGRQPGFSGDWKPFPSTVVCLGGAGKGPPHAQLGGSCGCWGAHQALADAGGGEARSFPGNYLAPSLGECNDLKGKLEGGGHTLIAATPASFWTLVGRPGSVISSGLNFCSPQACGLSCRVSSR